MRILHLVDLTEHASMPALACAAAMRRLPGSHVVWTIGSGSLPDARVTPAVRLPAPLTRPTLAWNTLRRAFADEGGAAESDAFDLVTAWSPGALAAAWSARLHARVPCVGVFARTPSLALGQVETRLQRAAIDACPILCFSEATAAAWRDAGACDVRLAPPVIPFDASIFPTRAAAREMLGIEPAERILALLADPPDHGDARRFVYLTGLLTVGGTQTSALLHAHNRQLRRAARFVRECGRLWRAMPVDMPLALALPACDAAVVDIQVLRTHPLLAPGADHTLHATAEPLAACLAASLGVPVVSGVPGYADELERYGIPVVRAADSTPLSIASALFPIIDARGRAAPAYTPSGAGALDVLHELWLEQLNAPLPGFPLTLDAPVPAAHSDAAGALVGAGSAPVDPHA